MLTRERLEVLKKPEYVEPFDLCVIQDDDYRNLLDAAEMYLVALWAMQMPCEQCPMAHPCMTLAASVGETACRRGFAERADAWRELWRKHGGEDGRL
jgi:hypothetical protein